MRRLLMTVATAIALVVLVGLAGCSPPGAGILRKNGRSEDTSEGTKAQRTADARKRIPTMVVLDASGSMKRDDAPGQRFAAAQKAITDLTGQLRKGHPIGLMTYGTRTGNTDADKPAGCRDVTRVLPVGPLDKTAYDAAVAQLRPRGYTPIGTALQRAAASLPTKGDRAIVLISDGVDTCAPPSPCDVARALHRSQPDLAISTVGFRVGGEAQTQLECIAEATGGSYLDATSGLVLGSRLAALFDPDAVARSIQPTGYRGLDLGMTAAQARAAADARASHAARSALGEVPTKGRLEIRYVDCTLVFEDGVLTAIRSTKSGNVSTVDGTSVGDQVSDVLATYGTSYSLPEPGVIQVPADTVAGTGYEIRYDGPTDSPTPSGTVTTITLCRCTPTLGTGKIAFSGVGNDASATGATLPSVWNGRSTVQVDLGIDYYDEADAVGFVGGRAVYTPHLGAHGYIDSIHLVDPETGRSVASTKCFTCEVLVSDGMVVAFNGFDGWIRRYDSTLRQIDQITVDRSPFAYFDGNDDVAGDPPRMFDALAASADGYWVEGADPGTDISSAFESGRIHRIDLTGHSVARSDGSLLRTAPGALSADGSTLVVPAGDNSFAFFDAKTLSAEGQTDQVDSPGNQWVSATGTDLTVVGGTCSSVDDTCPANQRPGVSVWNGSAWSSPGPRGTLCIGDLPSSRVSAMTAFEGTGEPFASIQITKDGQPSQVGTAAEADCVVDVPMRVD